jgi:hypothetical protein
MSISHIRVNADGMIENNFVYIALPLYDNLKYRYVIKMLNLMTNEQ